MHPPNDGCPQPTLGAHIMSYPELFSLQQPRSSESPCLGQSRVLPTAVYVCDSQARVSSQGRSETTTTTSFSDRSLPFLVAVVPVPMLQMLDGPFSSPPLHGRSWALL